MFKPKDPIAAVLSIILNETVSFVWPLSSYAFRLNKGIDLILIIQTFYPPALNVLYSKDV